MRRALDLGCNYIDTAPLYGPSEELLGKALAGERRPFYLATKVGFKPEGFDYRRDSVLQSLERSLTLLGLTKLTVAQIHEVNMAGWERIVEKGGTLEGLRAAQKQGLCDFIGVTGRAIPLLARLAATGEFDTVLCYHDYHPCVQLAAEEVLPAAAQSDMGVVLATVLAGVCTSLARTSARRWSVGLRARKSGSGHGRRLPGWSRRSPRCRRVRFAGSWPTSGSQPCPVARRAWRS